MGYLNGRLPKFVLARIPGGELRRDAAKAFNAMNHESVARFGVTLHPTGPRSSYRTLGEQQQLYALWKSGRGATAAIPGTSNHGWGLAVDFATPRMREIVDQIGAKYGWAKKWSDAPGEWWHLKWKSGSYPAVKNPPYGHVTIRPDSKGPNVLKLKQAMRRAGLRGFSRLDPWYRGGSVEAIKRLQQKHRLKADGVVGPKTWSLLL